MILCEPCKPCKEKKTKKTLHKVWLVALCLELQDSSSLSGKGKISKAENLAS